MNDDYTYSGISTKILREMENSGPNQDLKSCTLNRANTEIHSVKWRLDSTDTNLGDRFPLHHGWCRLIRPVGVE